MLAPVTPEALALIRTHTRQLAEVGAGDGTWARALRQHGVETWAFDLNPSGPGVAQGDHHRAADRSDCLLAIWPPDGKWIQDWVGVKPWALVIICASWSRLQIDDCLACYRAIARLDMPLGSKLCSQHQLRVYARQSRAIG